MTARTATIDEARALLSCSAQAMPDDVEALARTVIAQAEELAPLRNAVHYGIRCSTKVRCYLDVIEELRGKLDDDGYDAECDDWIVETHAGEADHG